MDSKYSLKLCFRLLALTSCVKSIDLTTGNRLVVECILSDVGPQTLRLDLTTGPTGIEKESLKDAVATLTDLTEQKTAGVFTRADDGLWHLDYAAIPEHKYRLDVEVPGYGATVWAEDTLPPAVDVFCVRPPFDQLEDMIEDKEFFEDYFHHFYEIPDSWRKMEGFSFQYDISSFFYKSSSIPDHTVIQGFTYDEKNKHNSLVESLCTDSPGVDNCNLNGSVYKSKRRWYPPFFSSASEVFSREEATGLGIINPRVDGYNCHRRFLRIEREKALSQAFFTISGDFIEYSPFFSTPTEYSRRLYYPYNFLLFSALSESYNAYLNDTLSSYLKSEDVASLYLHNYSNIKGGVGIFGSTTCQMVPISMGETIWELYDF